MSYEPTTWVAGDTVTAAKMNKMEQGIADGASGGGVLCVGATVDTVDEDTEVTTLDKTWQEIWNATSSGVCLLRVENELEGAVQVRCGLANMIGYTDAGGIDGYGVGFDVDGFGTVFTCDSPNEYPSYTREK